VGQARGSGDFLGIALGAAALALGAAAFGMLVNHLSPRGIPVFASGPPRVALPAGVEPMRLAAAHAAYLERRALFVDARSPAEYREGHVPGALNIPADEFEHHFLDHLEEIEQAPAVIVYCSDSECGDAAEVAGRLLEAYLGPLYVFEPGWRGWLDAGAPAAVGEGP